jgi:hypothetical protein
VAATTESFKILWSIVVAIFVVMMDDEMVRGFASLATVLAMTAIRLNSTSPTSIQFSDAKLSLALPRMKSAKALSRTSTSRIRSSWRDAESNAAVFA